MKDEQLLEIRVACQDSYDVAGKYQRIVMIPFSGEATGPLFKGCVIGSAVDTQRIAPDGKMFLSARYMLEGTDASGNACRVFIENQGSRDTGFHPAVVTDSPLLAEWETADLYATVDGTAEGVMVRIYQKTVSQQ